MFLKIYMKRGEGMLEKIKKQLIKPQMGRRILMLLVAHVIMGFAVGMFNLVLLGNDPFSSLMKAITAKSGLSYGMVCAIMNTGFFLIEILWGRQYIGLGTIVNWFGLGYFVMMWNWILGNFVGQPENLILRVILSLAAVVVLGLSLSLYQSADVGSAPFDSLPLVMKDKLNVPFFAGRIICDGGALLLSLLLGGAKLGIGVCTVFVVVGLGPVANYFNKHVCNNF